MDKIKCFLLILVPVTIIFSSCAQTKVYAYAQPVIGGVSPEGAIDESGVKQAGKPRSSFNHYLFICHNPNKTVEPIAIMIDGKAWQVKSNVVDSNQVYITDVQFPANPEKIVLVPETNKKILSLLIDYSKPLDQLPVAKTFDPSAVVFFYKTGDKMKHKELDKITMLKPVATM